MIRVKLKSAYLPYDFKDGARYLVETTWPEGVETHGLFPYLWVHELAPSYDLRERGLSKHWSNEKFRGEYLKQLQGQKNRDWFNLVLTEAGQRGVTLLHRSCKRESQIQPEDTSVYFLKEFLEEALKRRFEFTQPLTFDVSVPRSKLDTRPAVERWANEGGK